MTFVSAVPYDDVDERLTLEQQKGLERDHCRTLNIRRQSSSEVQYKSWFGLPQSLSSMHSVKDITVNVPVVQREQIRQQDLTSVVSVDHPR